MRDAVRRLFSVRPQPRIVQVRVPAVIAGRRGLPVLLSAFAVLAAASTAATTTVAASGAVAAPAGTTVLPPVAPPTYAYPGSSQAAGTPGGTTPGGTGLNSGTSGRPASAQLAAGGIPARAVQAYQQAAVAAGCGLPWTLVAAIGRVETDHGRFGGATLLSDGRSDPPVVGIPLDGRPGVAVIKDTDGGKWDGDRTYDRAVGPMQFIPSSWARFGVDGDGDGKTDPFDIDDAAAAAAKYLCKAGGGDLSTEAAQRNAVYSYNRSTAYVDSVMALAALYAGNAPVDNAPAPNRPPLSTPTLPAATEGDPPAAPGTTIPTPSPTRTTPTPTSHPTSPSSPAPTTTPPSSPAPSTTQPSSPAPTTTSPSPSPTCTPTPTPTPSSSGTNTPNGNASAASTPTGTASAAATGTASADASGTPTPTPTPTPTLPPCPS